MKIEEILSEWSEDAKINLTQLDVESAKIPLLHHKYYKLFITERLKLKKMLSNMKKLRLIKHDYYSGNLADEDCKKCGWEQFDRKLLKTDIDKFIDADSDVIEHTLKVSLQQEKVDLLDSIIKSLSPRGYNLRVAMDFLRFQNGG